MKQGLKTILSKMGYQVQGTRLVPRHLLDPKQLRLLEFDDVVCRHLFELERDFTFIQVGAFDGITKDPLRRYIQQGNWKGILVEPQPWAAAQLRQLYQGNDRISVLEAALDRESGQRTLYVVQGEDSRIPDWACGLASFNRSVILKHAHLIPSLESLIQAVAVKTVTFDQVLTSLGTDTLDLLQIDAEGADAYILFLFPFEKIKPSIVHWEVKHLNKSEREACFEQLAQFGYRFAPSGTEDMIAVKVECDA